ncbi:Fatty acid-binding protein, muscle [Pseudolycoriella hygida]|uniref:Fatty acid-binding protein, muscle n=1 Tax=Pseudolycoriella hygida TaxID=35572 RepID=A0A9Q0MPF9_9DIPT|nr:Fatty acid-binding protein, muscle [Pseudolycoriella hygida]
MTLEPFLNKKYKLYRTENSVELMDLMDLTGIKRKVASSLSATVQLVRNGDKYTLKTRHLILRTNQTFKLGEEKNVTTGDGRKVKNEFTIDGNKLTEKQIGEIALTIVREFSDEEMIQTYYCENVVSKGFFNVMKK